MPLSWFNFTGVKFRITGAVCVKVAPTVLNRESGGTPADLHDNILLQKWLSGNIIMI